MTFTLFNLHQISRAEFLTALRHNLEEHTERGGVYRLLLRDALGESMPVPRFLDTDETGVLYLGCCRSYAERLGALFSSIRGSNVRTHDLGRAIRESWYPDGMMSPERFAIEVEPGVLEAEALADYCRRFGESPPLNLRMRGMPPGLQQRSARTAG